LLFTATRAGTLHIFHEDTPDKFSVVETVTTEFGARNMALDPKHTDFSLTLRILLLCPNYYGAAQTATNPVPGRFDCWSMVAEP